METVRIGDRLTFKIEIPDKTPYGIFARSCVAMAKVLILFFERWFILGKIMGRNFVLVLAAASVVVDVVESEEVVALQRCFQFRRSEFDNSI